MTGNGNIIGNRGGIVYTTATQTDAGSTTSVAVYSLPNHTFRFLGIAGLMVVTIPTASAATVTGVNVSVNNQVLPLTSFSGDALTTLAAGDYIVSFNKFSNTLKLLY